MGILEEVLAKVDALRRTTGRNVQDLVQQPSLYVEKMTDALRNTNRGVVPVVSNGELSNRSLTPSERVGQTMGTLDFGGGLGVIKPKGGNWLSGQVEGALGRLRRYAEPHDIAMLEQNLANPEAAGIVVTPQAIERWQNEHKSLTQNQALNQWIEGPLTKYVKRDMGAPNDPIRKLADQGILHYTPNPDLIERQAATANRRRVVAGTEGVAQTPLGQAWENVADLAINSRPASEFQLPKNLKQDPWLADISPTTPINSLYGAWLLGGSSSNFKHLTDELYNSLQEGRLRPEQLKSGNFSVDAAVRHVAEINALRAKKAEEALQADMEGMPIHKDYPDQGYAWRQLMHEDEPTLQKWLTQEGDAMGHCVGGYCPDVKSGVSSIYSLRDAKGRPHVTIETTGPRDMQGYDVEGWPEILQIKGKANAAPKAEYLPFVQDFVRSGQWSDIGDAQNTGLSAAEIDQILRGKK